MDGKREAVCMKPCFWLAKMWDRGESYFAPPDEDIQSQEDYKARKPLTDKQIPAHFEWVEKLEERPEPIVNPFDPPPKQRVLKQQETKQRRRSHAAA